MREKSASNFKKVSLWDTEDPAHSYRNICQVYISIVPDVQEFVFLIYSMAVAGVAQKVTFTSIYNKGCDYSPKQALKLICLQESKANMN